jgi:hypothetical protein
MTMHPHDHVLRYRFDSEALLDQVIRRIAES